jgi:hypothetical protein
MKFVRAFLIGSIKMKYLCQLNKKLDRKNTQHIQNIELSTALSLRTQATLQQPPASPSLVPPDCRGSWASRRWRIVQISSKVGRSSG